MRGNSRGGSASGKRSHDFNIAHEPLCGAPILKLWLKEALWALQVELQTALGVEKGLGKGPDRHTPWLPSAERDAKDPDLAKVLRKVPPHFF